MFIEQGIKPYNGFWKYIIGLLAIVIAVTVGEIPLVGAAMAKLVSDGRGFTITQDEVMKVLDPNLTLFLLLLSYAVGLAGLIAVVKFIHGQRLREVTTGRPRTDWRRILFSFSVWTLISVVSTVVAYYNQPQDFVVQFKPMPFLVLFIIGTLMFPLQTSFEEYVFRGYLMQGFAVLTKCSWFPRALRRMWFPLIITSMSFGMLHYANPEVTKIGNVLLVYYVGTGFFLGIITLMDDGMELALGFHAANNLIGALLVTSDWTVFQTPALLRDISEPGVGFNVLFPLLIFYPPLLFIFSWKYKWSGWLARLTGTINVNALNIQTQIPDNDDSNSTYVS